MSHPSNACPSPISLAEYRSRRVRAGRAAPVLRFEKSIARRQLTHDEFTESHQARLRAAEDLAYRSPVRPVFVWGGALALTAAVVAALFLHLNH